MLNVVIWLPPHLEGRLSLRVAPSGIARYTCLFACVACSLGFGLLFPAYGSFMAIESSGTEDDTQVLPVSDSAVVPACMAPPLKFVLKCSGWSIGCYTLSFKALRSLFGLCYSGKSFCMSAVYRWPFGSNKCSSCLKLPLCSQDSPVWRSTSCSAHLASAAPNKGTHVAWAWLKLLWPHCPHFK